MRDLIELSARKSCVEIDAMHMVLQVLKRAKRAPASSLLKIVGTKGIMRDKFKGIMDTLIDRGQVRIVHAERGGLTYELVPGLSMDMAKD